MSRVTCRHGRTLRQGSLTNDEMRIVHGMMEAMEDDGDMDNMEILPAPVSRHPARGSSDRCKLGSKSYCPGEILFKYESYNCFTNHPNISDAGLARRS